MVYISQSLWNTLFGWMSGTRCFLPEGCAVPPVGVAVYLFILAVVAVIVYWYRHDIVDTVRDVSETVWDRIPNPFA